MAGRRGRSSSSRDLSNIPLRAAIPRCKSEPEKAGGLMDGRDPIHIRGVWDRFTSRYTTQGESLQESEAILRRLGLAFDLIDGVPVAMGRGQFAQVVRGKRFSPVKELVAMKIIDLKMDMDGHELSGTQKFTHRRAAVNEIGALQSTGIKHENVIRMFQHFMLDDAVYIILEYCNNGNLHDYILTNQVMPAGYFMSEPQIRYWFRQMTEGLHAMHSHNPPIFHRDLKPGNILVHRDPKTGHSVVKISDFTLCKLTPNPQSGGTVVGTVPYMPPQALMVDPSVLPAERQGWKYDLKKADVWALGVILYEMFYRRNPFEGVRTSNEELIAQAIMTLGEGPGFPPAPERSGEAQVLCRAMLAKQEYWRLTLSQVKGQMWYQVPDLDEPTAHYSHGRSSPPPTPPPSSSSEESIGEAPATKYIRQRVKSESDITTLRMRLRPALKRSRSESEKASGLMDGVDPITLRGVWENFTSKHRTQGESLEESDAIMEALGVRMEIVDGLPIGMGRGRFAQVVRAKRLRPIPGTVAMKIIDLSYSKEGMPLSDVKKSIQRRAAWQEIRALRSDGVKHPNVIYMFQHFMLDDAVYIILEYCNNGNLHDYIFKERPYPMLPNPVFMTEPQIRYWFRQIVQGLNALHTHKPFRIFHRDLKPENILVSRDPRTGQSMLKISDFGLCRITSHPDGHLEGTCAVGTFSYMAPQILLVHPTFTNAVGGNWTAETLQGKRNIYDLLKADIWALGVILYEMMFRKRPFEVNTSSFEMIKTSVNVLGRGIIVYPRNPRISNEAKILFQEIFHKKEQWRPTTQKIMDHMWYVDPQVEEPTTQYHF